MPLSNFIIPRTKVSTNTYASIVKAENCQSSSIIVSIKENDVNAVTYKVLVSVDGVTYFQLPNSDTEFEVAKNGEDYQTIDGYWRFVDVQIKSTVAGLHGNVNCVVSGQ